MCAKRTTLYAAFYNVLWLHSSLKDRFNCQYLVVASKSGTFCVLRCICCCLGLFERILSLYHILHQLGAELRLGTWPTLAAACAC